MGKRLKVLMSAFACAPDKGSEPEVGWQWAMQMSLLHDVTVLTRASNRAAIEAALASLRGTRPLPEFVYHDEGPFLLWFKERFNAIRTYYIFWQRRAWKIISRLHKERSFDLIHHVTFAGFRYRTAIWNHGAPTVWGPVGGILSIPWRLLPWKYPSSLFLEVVRHFNNFVQSAPFHTLPKRALMTTITLASTGEMEEVFARLGLESFVMPTIGLHAAGIPVKPLALKQGPLRVLFVGSVITLKGIDLAIHAMAEAKTDATFTIVGGGKFLAVAKNLVRKLGIESKVEFRGHVTRDEALLMYPEFDVFLFPSLHDTGGFAITEAMASGLPVICLDCGGPRLSVKEGAGIRVPLGSRKSVVQGLANAIRQYDANRQLLIDHGRVAREIIERDYDWKQRGLQMDAFYQQAVAARHKAVEERPLERRFRLLFNYFFPIKGLAVTAAFLFVIGTVGFFSVESLKHNTELIVKDTLPDLSAAGSVNSSMAEAFNRALLMPMAQTPEEAAAYCNDLETFRQRTDESLDAYAQTAFTPEERQIFDEMLRQQAKYTGTRQQIIELVRQHRKAEAMAMCKESLLPQYLDYKSSAEKLLQLNATQGEARSQTVLSICKFTQCIVAAIGVMLFVVGFLIGLFK